MAYRAVDFKLDKIHFRVNHSAPHDTAGRPPDELPGMRAKPGIETGIGNHGLRATGITDYLKTRERWNMRKTLAAHSSPRTTKLYDRRSDETALDEYEKVRI